MRFTATCFLGIGFFLFATGLAQETKEPVYVGVRACAECHSGPGAGHQFSKWLLSKHARAYSVLSLPEAKDIALISGVPQEPQEAPLCLGCHATAADTEPWEREDTFRIEDGVQCEKCHGAGSEYMDAEIMRNPEAAMKAGLRKFRLQDCMVCHNEKGSHVAVHKLPRLDMTEAWKRLSHPRPEHREFREQAIPTGTGREGGGVAKYVGVRNCTQCHNTSSKGFQFSKWRMSPHSRAWAVLATDKALEMAREAGVTGVPQEAPECLTCHSTSRGRLEDALASYSVDEGVGCEACHGAGSNYHYEAVMNDRIAAEKAGLKKGGPEICAPCHEKAHGKPFDPAEALKQIAHPVKPRDLAEAIRYKNPLNLAVSPDGEELYAACEASDSVIVVDTRTRAKVAEIPVGRQPHDVTFSPDGKKAYVTNRLDDSVSEIDTATRTVLRTANAGDEPHGVLTDPSGKFLYILNTSEDSLSILDTQDLKQIRKLATSRYPWSLALSPDGQQIAVTNSLSRFVPLRAPSISELTVLDVSRNGVVRRNEVPATNLLQGIAWHPSGEYALFTLLRTKNLVPMTRLTQGWTVTNGLGIMWKDGRVDQVLLDQTDLCFPDPADVAITPDGRYGLVTSSGNDQLAVLDLEKLIGLIRSADDYDRKEILPNHLGLPSQFIVKSLPTQHSPRSIVLSRDGSTAFVANCLDDSISVFDLKRLEPERRIDLGGPKVITKLRMGEQLFHNAAITFRRQFSCHTCHPDGHVDGVTYDIEPDGVGVSPVDNRTLRGILDTAPFKWEGTNPSLQRQCGPRLAVFFTRIQPFNPEQLAALDLYISSIPRPPNRYRPLDTDLTPAQRRGKHMFERTMTNDGREIAEDRRCNNCHPPPLFTNKQRVDVGTRMQWDRDARFDVPHLNNIYDSAPYLHNGAAPTLEEIWTVYNPRDMHGVTNDMTKDQLNDLIEYIKTF